MPMAGLGLGRIVHVVTQWGVVAGAIADIIKDDIGDIEVFLFWPTRLQPDPGDQTHQRYARAVYSTSGHPGTWTWPLQK